MKEGLWDIVTGTETFPEKDGVTDEGYVLGYKQECTKRLPL